MGSPQSNTGPSMGPREASVTYAVELLAKSEGFQSITITLQDTSGAYSVALATLFSVDSEMSQQLSHERGSTSLTLRRSW